MVWFISIALTFFLSYLSVLLGIILIVYSTFNLFGLRLEVKTKNEWWTTPIIGLIKVLFSGMTDIFAFPSVFLFSGNWISQRHFDTVNGDFIYGVKSYFDWFN